METKPFILKKPGIKVDNINFKLGQMLAFAKMGEWSNVDETLHDINSELWLTTELRTLEDVEEFIYAAGYDIYE